MKRKLTYSTVDGQVFDQRLAAQNHEINLKRRQRLEECLRECLPADVPFTPESLLTALCEHAARFSDALSARAANRMRSADPSVRSGDGKAKSRNPHRST